MELSKFFNSAPGDPRTYQASDFADYFGSVLSTGLLHTDNIPALAVGCEGTDLRTFVDPGRAIMQGYGYENTSRLYLEHALPEATLDRIDRIVLRLDKRNQSRFIRLFVVQGTAAETPVAPSLQRDEFVYELSLAQIRVRANTSTLNPADLVDERLDEQLCGLVNSLLTVPTSHFQAEWDAFMESVKDDGFTPLTTFNEHKTQKASQTELGHVKAETEEDGTLVLNKEKVGLSNVDNTKQMPISGGTFTGVVTAQSNTAYSTRQVRNVTFGTANPSGGQDGDIYFQYE
ncbi:hypothetical protein [Halalkalibacterium ligniniphilum]|uniref:hypothetical protein n=1 Tax=Halalkalibacterium ligniniphilum TaxID=1134413 RepID=UPI00034B8FDB|nr:hypothetical protein [Halalkalibacterium ligniniphilum]